MITGPLIADTLRRMAITHVVTVPDGTMGRWEPEIAAAGIELVRVCREGEAWTVAAGLHVGGAAPIVVIQCTGLFESGDALRNTLHEWKLPLYAMVGYRSYLNQANLPGDTSLVFTEPILAAWKLDVRFIKEAHEVSSIAEHYAGCRAGARAGVALIAEGRS